MNNVRKMIKKHYTKFLGRPAYQYDVPLEGYGCMTVYECHNQPCDGAVTLATVGMSDLCPSHTLQELIFCAYREFISTDLVKLLGVVVKEIVGSDGPVGRGEVLGPAGPLLDSTPMEALYICPPTYYPKRFARLRIDGSAISIVWLIPIHRSEAVYIYEYGYDKFESQLEELDPDLMDLRRPAIN